MSIRYKILMGCLSLTLLTVVLGGITRDAQKDLGDVATRIYDQALMALSYLRSSQNALIVLRAAVHRGEAEALAAGSGSPKDYSRLVEASVPAIREDLDVARVRAMSDAGRAATAKLEVRVDALPKLAATGTANLLAELEDLQTEFDTAVEIYAGDGFRYRRSVGQKVEHTLRNTWIAVVASVCVALLITFLLSRSIVPALREAVALAQSIAAGKLDNHITARGTGETSLLLSALATMQRSISDSLERIKALMADQAVMHESQIGMQNARFEAALNNMLQGLCMFDEKQQLSVYNRRFVEMFGEPKLGMPASAVMIGNLGTTANDVSEPISIRELSDGRIIAISNQPMSNGGWVATYEDITERRRVEERLSFMARHDTLTGLPNRALFREHMENTLAARTPTAVLCLDLDGFKNVNDTLGHPIGDALLCAVSERLKRIAIKSDLLVRLGGDEFALVRTGTTEAETLAALAGQIVETIGAPFEVDAHQIVIGTSVGIALSDQSTTAGDELLKNADMALYRAKAEGRGTFRFFEADMDARVQERRRLEIDLRGALKKQEFELFYQPLVNTADGEIAGFEALVRWRHPVRGMVPPNAFIQLAEEIGVIEDIGNWVLHTACKQATQWPEHIKIAVNLSPVQFRNRALAARVGLVLGETGLSPRRLELEITESVLLADSEAVLTILNELKLLGVSISMDDFGTGYSSLSYLRKFPFDKIKIDQCFVRSLFEADGLAIVRAVIGLGRSLNMNVIAEGVETEEQLRALQAEGCLQAQGYLFSKPKPAAEVEKLIKLDAVHSVEKATALVKSAAQRIGSAA